MKLTMYQGDSGRLMYRLDGKRINALEAEKVVRENKDVEIVDETECASHENWAEMLNDTLPAGAATYPQETVCNVRVADRMVAINIIENCLPTFYVDSSVKIEGAVYGRNSNGDEIELHDEFVLVKMMHGDKVITTYFWVDIPESRFIEELKKLSTDTATFDLTGDSGKVYTYSSDFDVICEYLTEAEVTESEGKISIKDFVIHERRLAMRN